MAKRSAFNEFFSEPRDFDESGLLLSAELFPTREEAAAEFSRKLCPEDGPVNPKRLYQDTVKFRFVGREYYAWWEERQVNGRLALWCLGETGPGAKPVWVLE